MSLEIFKTKNFFLFCALSGMLVFTGCVYVAVGGIAALGGYVVSPDTVQGVAKVDDQSLWDTAVEIVSIMGTIREEYHAGEDKVYTGKKTLKEGESIILAVVNGAKVTIMIVPTGANSAQLSIKARKAFIPKMTVAQDIFVKIMTHINE